MDFREQISRRTTLICFCIYAVVICAWVLLSDKLLDIFVSDSDSLSRYAFKGAGIIVMLLLALSHQRLLMALKIIAPSKYSARLTPLTVGVALSLSIAVMGSIIYFTIKNSVTQATNINLQAVAELKTHLINHWVEEEMEDFPEIIQPAIDKPEFTDGMVEWLRGGMRDGELHQKLVDYLRHLARAEHYLNVSVHAIDGGTLLLTTDGVAENESSRVFALVAAHTDNPIMEDFRVDEDSDTPKAKIGFFNAMRVGKTNLVVVVHTMRDASSILFPMIKQDSGWSSSAEILLLRREGNDIVLLNTTTHHPDIPLRQRFPMSTPDSIGTAAVSGAKGMLRGNGFGEVPVLAYALPVQGTPWFLMAELEEKEAYAKLNTISTLTFTIIAVLMLASGWWLVEHNNEIEAKSRYRIERAEDMRRYAELSSRLVALQELERRRLSSELHDRIGANLAAISLNLKAIAAAFSTNRSPELNFLLAETSTLITDTIVSIREFCVDLRPVILDKAGLVPALDELLQKFGRRTGTLVKLRSENFNGHLSKELELLLFRISQEALTNCSKHSNARTVDVEVASNDHKTILTISDDGIGFDSNMLGKDGYTGGMGVINMRERTEFAGGKFSISSRPRRGTQIKVELESQILHIDTQFDISDLDKNVAML